MAAYQHRLVFDLYPTQEHDPLLALIREKEAAEQQAAQAVQDALGEFIAASTSRAAGAAPAPARRRAAAGLGAAADHGAAAAAGAAERRRCSSASTG